ncbi:MAG TPA: low affinity iron permease family protein [Candidatus Limnocylindria bacterium]|jgi:low affinity Fe/Cu permease
MFQRDLARLVRLLQAGLASPWALISAAAAIVGYFLVGERIGLPGQRVDLGFLLTLVTFVMVFILEHNGARERDAIQAKLDELIRAVGDADPAKIGLEELHPDEIEAVRESGRQEGRRTRES